MQIHIEKILLVSISLLIMAACTPQMTQDLWNGSHTYKDPLRQKRDAYYEKETTQQKENRKINGPLCMSLASSPENRVSQVGYLDGMTNRIFFRKCMTERGSPLFD